ncbi:transcriptional regulator [Roseomonas sp. JC162]|uniref:Transcriptional regulator n=1 Tax=Neoroseomonas marina TaxID=1232220 RepID=A0A848EDL8_9PROT|nr:MucR family transcriptional regulator [Neoroseomonas marina]NMJ41553.1 transcriptional regulator [Neoroseomonas marina]
MTQDKDNLLKLTASIVAAHVSHNPVPTGDLPALITGVYSSLVGTREAMETPASAKAEPAVPIRRSIRRDHLVCLEDGRKLKMLKRYLATAYNLTPDQYRHKWGLPSDYPMVAPSYSERRSALAKEIGLGSGGRRGAVAASTRKK